MAGKKIKVVCERCTLGPGEDKVPGPGRETSAAWGITEGIISIC